MQGNLFYGSGTALITPFKGTRVDYDALERLIDFQIDNEADALVVLGTTGEPSTITESERSAIIECAVARCARRVPLLIGTGTNCTQSTVRYSLEAMRAGADGLLVVTPYYNKTSACGLKEHYMTVADSVEIPVVIYNVPGRTGLNFPLEILPDLIKHPMLRGFKEACTDIRHAIRLFEYVDDQFFVYCGNDDMTLPMMALGARGVITVAGNIIPDQMHALTACWMRGDTNCARAIQASLQPLLRALSNEVNPIPIKAAMSMMKLAENTLRAPLAPLEDGPANLLRRELRRLDLIPDDE